MRAVGLIRRRGARAIALALAAGLVGFEVALGLSLGAVGVPGLFLVHLGGESRTLADSAPSANESHHSVSQTVPIARPLTPDARAVAQSQPPPSAAGDVAQTAPSSPVQTAETAPAALPVPAKKPEQGAAAPARAGQGPVGWKGPNGPPDADGTANGVSAPLAPAPKLDGPIKLDVPGAVADLDHAKAKEEADQGDAAKQAAENAAPGGKTANGSTASRGGATREVPNQAASAGGPNEILPWDETKPDPTLTGPLSQLLPGVAAKPDASRAPAPAANSQSAIPQASPMSAPSAAPIAVPTQVASAAATVLTPQGSATPGFPLPPLTEVQQWVRGRAAANQGGTDDSGRPLYRFELWLEPPASVRAKLSSVSYYVDAPSARPQTQESRQAADGFHIEFGGLACVDHITLTLTFDDGRSERVPVNGCTILG